MQSDKDEEIDEKYEDQRLVEIVRKIIMPLEWSNESKHYVQYISQMPSSREDVSKLHKLLDERLIARQAREVGLCYIRSELHSQCFDEIIRQCTINSSETGLLLIKVRDQMKMTIQSYRTLYENSVKFGQQKQQQASDELNQLQAKVQKLSQVQDELQQKKIQLIEQKEILEKQIFNKNLKIMINNAKELNIQMQQQDQLNLFLESITKINF